MAKYFGKIGYAELKETEPGVWTEEYIERPYFGDFMSNSRNLQSSGDLNDNVTVSLKISIVSDPYAELNFHAMRYLEWMGTKWKITSVEKLYPRLILIVGGVYNA